MPNPSPLLPYVLEEPVQSFPKTCTKCRWVYASRAEWDLLRYVGVQDSGEPEFDLELRTCACHSTIAIRIPKYAASEPTDGLWAAF